MPTLDWIGKAAVVDHHRKVPYRLLRCDRELSTGNADAGNLLVQGDNLLALKALLPYYAGKVKCIYIDPPYNTGNENWVYNDNVNSPEIRKWLNQVVGKEGEDLSRHDKWLCMMYPRLALLKEFLADDGVILCHIDEHSLHYLLILLEELFGRSNILGHIVWDKRNPKGDAQGISYQHESLVLFAREKEKFLNSSKLMRRKANAERIVQKGKELFEKIGTDYIPDDQAKCIKKYKLSKEIVVPWQRKRTLESINVEFAQWIKEQRDISQGEAAYRMIDDNGDVFRLVSMAWPNKKTAPDEYFIPLIHPKTKKPCPVPVRGWRNPPDTMKLLLERNEIIFGDDESIQPQRKYLLRKNLFENMPSLFSYGASDDALFRIMELSFENPKPYQFCLQLIGILTQDNDIIRDSFAGSGTTAHAVLAQNAADGGNRRFILVEMDENICRNVTAQRVRKAIYGYNNTSGLGGGFRYCKLGGELFDAMGNVSGEVRFSDLAAHVYFTETGSPLPKRSTGKSPLLGVYRDRAVYLLYNGILGDRRVDGGNVLTHEIALALPPHNGMRVVYGEACRLGKKSLERYNIVFRQIPYALKVD